MSNYPVEPEKHSTIWIRKYPSQTAADIDSLKLAVRNIKNLLATGASHDLAEAKEWAKNAAKL
jgi:hypothetical protein